MNPRLAHLEKLVSAGTQDPFVIYALAMEYQREARMNESLEVFERVISEHPTYLPSYLMAGNAWAKEGDSEKARATYLAGISQAKAAGDAHTQGEIEDALAELS